MDTAIKYSELAGYILGILNKLRQEKGQDFYSLNDILDVIEYRLDLDDIRELGTYLEAKGWVDMTFIYGEVMLKIKPAGIFEVENEDKSIILKFDEFIQSQNRKEKIGDAVEALSSSTIPRNKIKVEQEVDFISNALKSNYLELLQKNPDITTDLDIIKAELKKKNPDINALRLKISSLEDFDLKLKDIFRKLRVMLNIVNYSY